VQNSTSKSSADASTSKSSADGSTSKSSADAQRSTSSTNAPSKSSADESTSKSSANASSAVSTAVMQTPKTTNANPNSNVYDSALHNDLTKEMNESSKRKRTNGENQENLPHAKRISTDSRAFSFTASAVTSQMTGSNSINRCSTPLTTILNKDCSPILNGNISNQENFDRDAIQSMLDKHQAMFCAKLEEMRDEQSLRKEPTMVNKRIFYLYLQYCSYICNTPFSYFKLINLWYKNLC